MKGILLQELLGTPNPTLRKPPKGIVLKTCMQVGTGTFYSIGQKNVIETENVLNKNYILLKKDFLDKKLGPDVILTVYRDGRTANIYGGEWNDGEY